MIILLELDINYLCFVSQFLILYIILLFNILLYLHFIVAFLHQFFVGFINHLALPIIYLSFLPILLMLISWLVLVSNSMFMFILLFPNPIKQQIFGIAQNSRVSIDRINVVTFLNLISIILGLLALKNTLSPFTFRL